MVEYTGKKPNHLLDELVDASLGFKVVHRLARISVIMIEQKILMNETTLECWKKTKYLTGSFYEGMPSSVCGDRDYMVNYNNFPIILHHSPAEGETPYKWGHVIAEQIPDEPAFLRLRAMNDKGPYVQNVRGFAEANYEFQTLCEIGLHGPALNELVPVGENSTITVSVDNVACLKCPLWPSITDEYFTRLRLSNWPSCELLARVLSLGCLAVPVAHPNSSSKNSEWRWSFSLAERELIHGMSEPYVKCMYALKAVKNKYIVCSESENTTPFCSYFIKTACLWMCERHSHRKHSTMDLIRKTLDFLIECYQQICLPHYFIPKQNLIGHLSIELCDCIRSKLIAVKRNAWEMVMSSIHERADYEVINVLCSDLKITSITEPDDYKTLEMNLLTNSSSKEAIGKYICSLNPGGILYNKYKYLEIVECAENEYSLFALVQDLIEKKSEPVTLLRIPDEIILPIINNIAYIVPDEYQKMLVKCLYRLLGDVYMYLLIYFQTNKTNYDDDDDNDDDFWLWLLDLYHNKPMHYYDKGIGTLFPKRLNSCCIDRLARVARYEYLMGNHNVLNKMLTFYQPLLCGIKDNEEIMNRHVSMMFNSNIALVFDAWAIDEKIQCVAKESRDIQIVLFLHPVVIVFYIQARIALKFGDNKKAAEIVEELEVCLKTCLSDSVKKTTSLLIEIIYNELRNDC